VAAVPALAHTLKGSARGIGAWRVADAAENIERAALKGEKEVRSALAQLESATAEARAAIAELLQTL
jgi:HPt (histidine-containing phosphotransfer) domain-containing protein